MNYAKNCILLFFLLYPFFLFIKSPSDLFTLKFSKLIQNDISYSKDIKPIIEAKCIRCHNDNYKAGYNFKKIESLKRAGTNGKLIGSIKHIKGFHKMPRMDKKLDQVQIDKIDTWVKNGMKDK